MATAKPKRRDSKRKPEPACRSVEGWAVTVLLDAHAIVACESHGFIRDRADPDAWQRARMVAAETPFASASAQTSLQAIEDVMCSVGDTCPECEAGAFPKRSR